jgi:hypothetical protein
MNEKTQVTQAERDNWWEERMSQPYPRAKPKPKPQITAEVSPQTAEAVKANPQSLRLSAHSADGVTVIDRPRLFSVLEVLEVDAQGRPPLGRSYDPATNSTRSLDMRRAISVMVLSAITTRLRALRRASDHERRSTKARAIRRRR